MADDIYDSKAYDSSEVQSEQSSQGQSQTEETKQTGQGEPQIYRPAPESVSYTHLTLPTKA